MCHSALGSVQKHSFDLFIHLFHSFVSFICFICSFICTVPALGKTSFHISPEFGFSKLIHHIYFLLTDWTPGNIFRCSTLWSLHLGVAWCGLFPFALPSCTFRFICENQYHEEAIVPVRRPASLCLQKPTQAPLAPVTTLVGCLMATTSFAFVNTLVVSNMACSCVCSLFLLLLHLWAGAFWCVVFLFQLVVLLLTDVGVGVAAICILWCCHVGLALLSVLT